MGELSMAKPVREEKVAESGECLTQSMDVLGLKVAEQDEARGWRVGGRQRKNETF